MVLEDISFEITPRDKGKIVVEIFNAYNGKNAYGYSISALRLVCTNGMRGFRKVFGEAYTHRTDVIDRIRATFPQKLDKYQEQIQTWKNWTEIPMSKNAFGVFVEDQSGLGAKLKKDMVENFDTVCSRFGDSPTKWGAFNVLTYYQTHMLKARQGSPLFTANYYHFDKALNNFYDLPMEPGMIAIN